MDDLMVMIQGFGAVGANAARFLSQRLPGARVVGVSDAYGYLYNQNGLPIDKLFALWQSQGLIDPILLRREPGSFTSQQQNRSKIF